MRQNMTNSKPKRAQNMPKTATSKTSTVNVSATSDSKTSSSNFGDPSKLVKDVATALQADHPKRIRGDVSKRLQRAARRVVAEHSDDIANALLDHTLEGNSPCAKLLLSLLHPPAKPAKSARDPKPDAPKPLRSLAEEWASEPEWTGSDEEGLAWWQSQRKAYEDGFNPPFKSWSDAPPKASGWNRSQTAAQATCSDPAA